MSVSRENLDVGLTDFGSLVEAEYGLPITQWSGASAWSDLQKRQMARALDVAIKAPIADPVAASPEEIQASETGARRNWVLADARIAGREWEGSWQWELLAAIDNATKAETGQMMTPSDPRMFVLRTRYQSDFFAVLAAYLSEALCGRALVRAMETDPSAPRGLGGLLPDTAADQAAALGQIPGFATVSPAFMAGLLFMIDQLGPKSFCDWCEDFC